MHWVFFVSVIQFFTSLCYKKNELWCRIKKCIVFIFFNSSLSHILLNAFALYTHQPNTSGSRSYASNKMLRTQFSLHTYSHDGGWTKKNVIRWQSHYEATIKKSVTLNNCLRVRLSRYTRRFITSKTFASFHFFCSCYTFLTSVVFRSLQFFSFIWTRAR